ncbi:BQ2448_3356 [Microbotryum intermedium]|uniref:BQ2448_3356 protein n=1 Tax=Microbotryum intermedium TaxID=269621 RepID=A0A238FFE9_9BASI|nr:BQ2448_3356 [Microbotryum intermedium]
MSYIEDLRKIEQDFVAAVKSGDELVLRRAERALAQLSSALSFDTLSSSEVSEMRRISDSIFIVCSGINRFASSSEKIAIDSHKRLRQSLAEYGLRAFKDLSPQIGHESLETSISSDEEPIQPYRTWFLDNFAWPYPESSERLRLLAQIPAHGRAQLSNWFVNSRRRSGWSLLAKKYACGDRDAFATFLRKIDDGKGTEEEVEDVEKCKAHFMDKGTMLVRDGIEEVLTAASMGALMDGCVPSSKRIRSSGSSIKTEEPGQNALSKKRRRVEDVEDPLSSPRSKRSTSGSWTDSSGVLSNDTAETSTGSTSDFTTPRRKSPRVPRAVFATAVRPNSMSMPFTPGRLPHSPHIRSISSPLSSPTAGAFTRSRPTYRAVSSSFTIEQPNLAGELALPPPPIQITSNEHFATLATEPWNNLTPWLNFAVDLDAI